MYQSFSHMSGSSQGSRFASVMTVPKLSIRADDKHQESDFNLNAFLNSCRFESLIDLDDADLDAQLGEVDALDLFNAVQEVSRDLATVRLENHFITDFLDKNDPKLLIGLKQRRATATSISATRRSIVSSFGRSTPGGGTARMSSRPSIVTAQSFFTTSSMMPTNTTKKTTADYRLNYRAKAEMAEKTAAEVEKRIADMEAKAMRKIKMLNTRIEEMRYSCAETHETAKNFELHFLKDERDLRFLESASERQLERKLRKFVNNWLKNGRALLGTMRLRITSLREICQQHRNDLMTKADLSGMLRAVDFEQLVIKRDELLSSLEEKINHLNGLKNVTGKASLAMSEEKKIMANIENESKRISNKTSEIFKAITKLEREAKYVENENNKDLKVLAYLHEQVKNFEAPSVNEYIERKGELLALEKEEKMLQRKIYISNMKLNNTLKRCKRHDDATDVGSIQ